MNSDVPYLQHIADSIAAIRAFVAGGRDVFLNERMVHDAVIRNFEIIGEAANRLSPEIRNSGSAPWARIVAFRNRLIHGYWGVDLILVWDVIEKELPLLEQEVSQVLARLSPSQ